MVGQTGEVEELLSAKNKMLDEMGVYQHHDAVSGTARQAVADDYAKRLYVAMQQNNQAYGTLIDQ